MRIIRYAFLALLAIILITVAMANRQVISLYLLPESMAGLLGPPGSGANSVQLPLFLVIFAGIVAGLLVGFVWEWLREHRLRAEATRAKRDVRKLSREVSRLKGGGGDQADDVLALLEDGDAKR